MQKLAVSWKKSTIVEGNIWNDYYGILKDVIKIEYISEPLIKPVNDLIPKSLVDKRSPLEEVNDDMGLWFILVNGDIDEEEGDEGDEEAEWDNGNEIDEVDEVIHLHDDDDDDDDDDDENDDKDEVEEDDDDNADN